MQTLRNLPTVLCALLYVITLNTAPALADHARPLGYLKDIRPILAENCFTCHGPDGEMRQAELRLDQREDAIRTLPSGKMAIVPGDLSSSELIARIGSSDAETLMPPPDSKHQLSAAQKALLTDWIKQGANYEKHWAFEEPVLTDLPDVRNTEWIRNEIDRFILAGIEAEGLGPSPEADRLTLLRRLSLDLTGLPPTLEEIQTFQQDRSEDAYERLVDQLLASPHYGEKLAQSWLDLARFGDTSGYQDDNDRPNFPYRDYVIDAFNRNLPFDQFTIENLAGDLIPEATRSQLVASGFNRLHRHNEEGGSDPDEFRVVYTVDRTNTTAATWMGLTFGCAQCHDHKYDPVTQKEYYELFAFFNSLEGEVPILKGAVCPPQIRVPNSDQQRRIDELKQRIVAGESRVRDVENENQSQFEQWLATESDSLPADDSPAEAGSIGGVIARTSLPAYFGDFKLATGLSFSTPLQAKGRIFVTSGVNTEATVGYFSAASGSPQFPAIGMEVAEGPRFFAAVTLPNGKVIHSQAINAEYQKTYEWKWIYQADEKRLTVMVSHESNPTGQAALDLKEAELPDLSFNAFGISVRSLDSQNVPIEFYLDELSYLAGPEGDLRKPLLLDDPKWTGYRNQDDGHRFGYVKSTPLGEGEQQRIHRLLRVPVKDRLPEQVQQLRDYFLREYAPAYQQGLSDLALARKELTDYDNTLPLAMIWKEMPTPRMTRILKRGDFQQPADVVERNVPGIFPQFPEDGPRNRLGLARWLVGGHHPLTSRVIVNRIWTQLMGAGLVRTPDDFGIRGELPTHPELLDRLAVRFHTPANKSATSTSGRDQAAGMGWDLKQLMKLIVMSSTYRQSSVLSPELRERDPTNRLFARGTRFRLTAEEIRDSALVASGLLAREVGGPSVFPYQPSDFYSDKEDDPGEWQWNTSPGPSSHRRGIYTFIRRTSPYPAYQTFDAPSRGECVVARSTTNTPLQALITLNDPVFMEAAQALGIQMAGRTGTVSERIQTLFQSVLTRFPTAEEQGILLQFYEEELKHYASQPANAQTLTGQGIDKNFTSAEQTAAWTLLANVLLNLDEAITRE
ncbi:PSD1 and planctomycete cytochrome C domain-containing protein [Planctomicrobium sp. SH661]|uniref:PSD1 and planctomycete cytochrome C domain-containing protein n=1 Tax=Planctomicrobium sp. SH661 TaxID=3448124 RepID=UPI003F5C4310